MNPRWKMRLWMIPGFVMLSHLVAPGAETRTYPVVDTGVTKYFDDSKEISRPRRGRPFYGQDAQYKGNQPSYRKHRNGTVTDRVTGLMWTTDPGEKMTLTDALVAAENCTTGGYDDWRVPTIKELYSLILHSGVDPSAPAYRGKTAKMKPFLDMRYFHFTYGDTEKGERVIDSQFGSQTVYKGTTMGGNPTMFGVNFADGRIKGYPIRVGYGPEHTRFFIFVRGNPEYGKNRFVDNGDGTITDEATGLMWMQVDSGQLKAGDWEMGGLSWEQALAWTEDLEYAGYKDWRLPNIKELQSIVDYERSLSATNSPAIDPLFQLTPLIDESGKTNYPFYWSSTTHENQVNASAACYIAFGEALGWLKQRSGSYRLYDVHGAGAQRSDPKSGSPNSFPYGRGPQGDVIRIYNFVLAVRDADD